jgi:hypothetical protein
LSGKGIRTIPLFSPQTNPIPDYLLLLDLGDRRALFINLPWVASKMIAAIHITIPMIFTPHGTSSIFVLFL